MPQRGLWLVSHDGSDLRRLGGDTAVAASVRDIAWLPGGDSIVSLRGTGIWLTSIGEDRDEKLADVGEGATDLSVSPDGDRAAFRKGGDLWLFDLDNREAVAATDVGLPRLSPLPLGRYARPEREIGPGIWGGPTYAWSADGRYIAVHYVDRREMRSVPFPDYLAEETDPNNVRRGYPGDANESRTVGLLEVSTFDLRLLDLENPTGNQIVVFDWSSGGRLLLDIASDTAVDRWLYTIDPESLESREIWHSQRDSRIYTSFASTWHPNGQDVVFLSDIGDRYGLYGITAIAGNNAPRLLTDPAYDVLGGPTVLSATNEIHYAGNGEGVGERHAYRVSADGSEPKRVTRMPGQNNAFPSPDGQSVAILHSDDVTPTELYLAAADGGNRRRVTNSPTHEFADHDWARIRYVSFPSQTDGSTLHARIMEPSTLDDDQQYPVIFGPMYSNTVRNRWAGIYNMVQQLLVQKGYIVVQVDVRGSTGYGRQFREDFLTDFAGEDIEDIASAVTYLQTMPYVDVERMGIWGSSYGGTLTVYTLLKNRAFSVPVSLLLRPSIRFSSAPTTLLLCDVRTRTPRSLKMPLLVTPQISRITCCSFMDAGPCRTFQNDRGTGRGADSRRQKLRLCVRTGCDPRLESRAVLLAISFRQNDRTL